MVMAPRDITALGMAAHGMTSLVITALGHGSVGHRAAQVVVNLRREGGWPCGEPYASGAARVFLLCDDDGVWAHRQQGF